MEARQWTYKVEVIQYDVQEHLEDILIDLGKEGWELVSVTPAVSDHERTYIFKKLAFP